MPEFIGQWSGLHTVRSAGYICGHCGRDISSDKAYVATYNGSTIPCLYICHSCNLPSFLFGKMQVPGSTIGGSVKHLPKEIETIYNEIRKCTTSGAFTAAVMTGRKLIMHIAVSEGAKNGLTYEQYVDFLDTSGYVPPKNKGGLTAIRKLGNKANHEIVIMDHAQATSMIKFLEMLLKFNYEFPTEQKNTSSNDKRDE